MACVDVRVRACACQGADIKEMAPKSYMDNFLGNWLSKYGAKYVLYYCYG